MYVPLNYEHTNNLNSLYIPSNVKYLNTRVFAYWERSLFQRAMSVIEIDVPESWKGNVKDFLYYCLFRFGHVAVFEKDDLGIVFNPGTFKGFDFYYQPTNYLIANPKFPTSIDLEIGKDCELIKLTPDFMGIWDIISYHAEKLASLDSAINMSIINSKFGWIFGARNKGIAQTIKKIYDKLNRGEPLIVYDAKMQDDPQTKKEPWQFLDRQNIKSSYITTDQLADFQTILNNFDSEIGIPTVPYHKKERMVTSEADSRVIDSTSRSIIWYETIANSLDKVNAMFNLGLSCKLRFEQESAPEGGTEDEQL